VRDAGVAGRPDAEWGEAVTAWVVLEGGEVADEELLAHCRARLAPHKVPKAIHRVGALPRNAAGKLLRRSL
jgi:acyl-CoA synthetase (AMP-forming)/AMP-acid ligase II